MKSIWGKLIAAFVLIFLLTLTVFVKNQTGQKLSTLKDFKADIKRVPCENEDRFNAVKKLFKKMDASDNELSIESFENVENLVVTKRGKTDEIVIVGAHYDKTSRGCGAIDNWTGIVTIAHLYRRIKKIETEKTYKFVAFGKEEVGLVGSKAMANSISENERQKYCAMINFDSFGFSFPQALENASDETLIRFAKETSIEMETSFSSLKFEGANSDSDSFRDVEIPAITFHGLSSDWKKYLHQNTDQNSNLKPESVYQAYFFALKFLSKIDSVNCGEFRK